MNLKQEATVEEHDVHLRLRDASGREVGHRVYTGLGKYVQGVRESEHGPVLVIVLPASVEMEVGS